MNKYQAADEVKPGHAVLGERRVEAATHLAGHVLQNILLQQRLDILCECLWERVNICRQTNV